MLFDGNITADAIQRDPRINPMHLMLGGGSAAREFNLLRRPDVAFNLICNAESSMRALNSAASICNKFKTDGVPVPNPPDRVRETTRTDSLAFFWAWTGCMFRQFAGSIRLPRVSCWLF